ncbi:mitochondrial inner membrane protease subunit 1 [Nomia melanderi]|uniref:mitochondrial inner membrane protease subunit 1 n=1 Tax=Nomia melanderi TaxID=2448451 RepID=UPI0013043D60|nr:mitochondrial inner membrane protease subunit 1 [Nomia melanderi]
MAMLVKFVRKIVSKTVLYTCVIHCIYEYLGDIVVCAGPSMEPTLRTNDVLLTERISVRTENVRKGDIVVSKCPSDPKQHICKRVIGLPGDKLKNGIIVPNGHVWLEGDNSNNSNDSREYGVVPQGLLRGRAFCKILPLRDVTFFVRDNTKPPD